MRWNLASRRRWTSGALLAILGTTAALAAGQQADGQVSLVGGIPLLVVDRATNSGQVWLFVRNPTARQMPLTLALSNFASSNTGRTLATQATLLKGTATTGTPLLEDQLTPNQTLPVKIQVANLWEAGESTATLTINDTRHTLRAVHYDVPFNVGILSAIPDKPQLSLERGRSGQVILKNDDGMTYDVAMSLFIPNQADAVRQTVRLPPKSTQPVEIAPPASWFTHWFEGYFKDEQRGAYLALRFAPQAGTDAPDLPVKTLPVELRLADRSETARAWVGGSVVYVVLLLGGICSLVLSLWIPNKLRRIDLARRLDELAGKTRAISSKTDSRLRVAVRVERLRLWETLKSVGIIDPDAVEQLKGFDQRIEMLGRRIELIKQLDDVSRKLDTLRAQTSGAPPTLLDQIGSGLDQATELLDKPAPADADFQQAQSGIAQAEARLAAVEREDPDLAKVLAARVKQLRSDYDEGSGQTGQRAKCKELRPKLPELFKVLGDATYEDAANITPDRYHWIDIGVEKLYVLRHYIIRFEDAETDSERQHRIAEHEADLLKYLRLQNWYALDLGRRLRKKIEQDIFASDVEAQLQQGKVRVEREPITVYPNEPARLTVRFLDPTLNTCTARRDFVCIWDFGDKVGLEEGWDITHYFRKRDEADFTVKFRTTAGKPVTSAADQQDITIQARIPLQAPLKDKRRDRAKIEAGRLLLALGIAAVALVAGAREQLLKLDLFLGLIAVFLVGFGADTIKNLFAKRV